MTNAKSLITLQAQLGILVKCNNLYSKLTGFSVNNAGITNIVKELKRVLFTPVIVIDLITHEQFPKGVAIEKDILEQLIELNLRKKRIASDRIRSQTRKIHGAANLC